MKLLSDIWEFLQTLNFVDYIFFFAIVVLLILIITLIYFIRVNDDVFEDPKIDSNDLKKITKQLEEEQPRVEFTPYEKDQEEKAIISYEELLNKSKSGSINYEEEHDVGDVHVKKINLDELVSDIPQKNPHIEPTPTVRVISYQKEEEFLRTLKTLQSLLN
jgi:hypothetical protein